VVANCEGFVTTVKCDEFGFTLVNFERFIPFFAQSFAFPMHINQFFFVNDVKSQGN
jgi:hypothetical protein